MPETLSLLPAPRQLTRSGGAHALADRRLILLASTNPQALCSAASRLQQALSQRVGLAWEVVASPATPRDQITLTLRVAPEAVTHPQGYELSITPEGIAVEAHDEAGVFYAICTLVQIIEQSGPQLPCLRISDWPDFPVRGVMLDVSRDKVPTLDTLLSLVDLLAGWKINHLQLYTEHTFAYRRHPEVWANASPLTGQDIMALDAYCRERFIELVPNQNSFGHMERWLKHERYRPLAEVVGRFEAPWGTMEGPFSLCPLDPGSLDLLCSLYDELLPHFSSRLLNVGCDETFDLGQGRSKDECARRGTGRVYLDFLLKICREVKARDHTMLFWGDIILRHPELIPELPSDAVALEWGYEADHPFEAHGAQFASAGLKFHVCPGTSSWTSVAGRTHNALQNLMNAAENGLKHGAAGYLITDWGDLGHWQVLPISYLGLTVGAAYAWALESNRALEVPRAVSWHAFRDASGVLGQVAYDLGEVYRSVGIEPHNSSALFWILQRPLAQMHEYAGVVTPETLRRTLHAIDQAVLPLDQARSARPDAGLLMHEFAHTARLLRHACRRGLLALTPQSNDVAALDRDLQEIIYEFRQIWLARNRPGGLADSAARLERARTDYTSA